MRLFLDMDGCFADFINPACARHGVDADELYRQPRSKGVWHTETLMGITPAEFWSKVRGHDFWATLPWMPDGRELVRLVAEVARGDFHILTSPSDDPGAYSGKYEWLSRELPDFRRRVIPFEGKALFAELGRDRVVLIDDSDSNVSKFRAAGGLAVLVPRPWNSLHETADAGGALAWVRKNLETVMLRVNRD